MPLYTDSNYYYSGGSSQLFSPYYPGSSSIGSSSSSIYSPYTSTYNRAIGGSYVVPISTSRSPSYNLTSSSRYQPKLSTITESSPLMSVARHSTLMPLTRINSPKYTSYSSTTPVHLPKYVPPKPILINTADIDVSANRYRRRKEEALRQAQLEHEAEIAARMRKGSETETDKKIEMETKNETDRREPQITQKGSDTTNNNLGEESPRRNRSTIKRNRAVVRLSTIRSRSKDRNKIKVEDLYSPEPEEKKFKDLSEGTQSQGAKMTPKDILLNKETLQEVVVELDPKYHTVRRLSIPQCPTFHDICEDISSDKIDDDLNAGELRRRQSVIQIQEQQLLNQLQKSPSGTFQMINLERRDSHDSTDSQAPKRHSKRLSKKGNKIRHKITAIVEVENASPLTADSSLVDPEKSPLPKFTVNVDSVEELHAINKVFKLPKKKAAKKAIKGKEQTLPEGFMSAIARPQSSPEKKILEKKDTFKTTAEIFTFDEKALADVKIGEEGMEKWTPIESLKRSQSEEIKSPSTPSKLKDNLKEEPKTPTKVLKGLTKTEEKYSSPKLVKAVELKTTEEKFPAKMDEDTATPKPLGSTVSRDAKMEETKFPAKVEETETAEVHKTSETLNKGVLPKVPLEKSGSISVKLNTPTTPIKLIPSAKDESVKSKVEVNVSTPTTLKSDQIHETNVEPNSIKTADAIKETPLEKFNIKDDDLKSPSKVFTSKSMDVVDKPRVVKALGKTVTSAPIDAVDKPSVVKPLGKTSSITVELKSPTTPTKFVPTSIKEGVTEDLPVATPKPIRKCIKRSESGEDFWAQIGSRETLYMSKRKQELVESQWNKRENLLESTTNEEVSNLEDIKTTVRHQKEEALKKADDENLTSNSCNIGRSSSNESALIRDVKTTKNNRKEDKKTETLSKGTRKEEDVNKEAIQKLKEAVDKGAVSTVKDEENNNMFDKAKTLSKIISEEEEAKKKAANKLKDEGVNKGVSVNKVKEEENNDVFGKTKALSKITGKEEEQKMEGVTKIKEKEEKKDCTANVKEEEIMTNQAAEISNKLKEEVKQEALTKIKSEEKVDKKSSPIKKKLASPNPKPATDKTIDKSGAAESKEAKLSAKVENSKPKISTTITDANAKTSSATTTTTTTTTTPTKIIGQAAKSPEQQEQEEKNTKQTTQAKGNNNSNKNELGTNKTSEIATKTNDQPPALLAKSLTSLIDNNSNAKVTANTTEAAATKQPETKAASAAMTAAEIKQTTTVAAAALEYAAKPTKKLQSDATKPTTPTTPTKIKTQTPPKAKAKVSPQSVINADQFIAKAPAKPNASPVKQAKVVTSTTSSSPPNKPPTTTTLAQNAPTKKTPDAKKKTTNATSNNANNKSTNITTKATPPTATATSTLAAASTTTTTGEIRNEDVGKNRSRFSNTGADDDSDNATTTIVNNSDSPGGGNLSKFATVSNLAQCLQDVDADLDDYIPSSAEISEDENYTDDSDFDYSSIDGWDKFTPSMKKKIKQRRRKEKQAEQARFDPQKKVKIDTTRKLYVKEEAPRYPLVATPRPLWKREKIVYPVEDSDESDSEESGSTEETEESDECTTSEEFEDELNPTASGAGASPSGGSGNSNSDPNIIRMSTCSNDSGFEGGTAPSSPKKMLECDVNCHKKCERLTANLCGVNQKLIVEALANVKRGARETRDSPSTPPSLNPAYKIEANEEQDETSYTYSQFQKSGRFTPPATIIPRFKNYTVDDFHFLAVLGKGSFGKVLLAELRDTTYYYAVKCLKKDVVLEDDDVDSTLIERKVLALGTKHPYLCHLFCTFQTESHLFFVMEYLNGGDLMFHIQESGRFTEERARFYGAEIISGLKFLHKKGIIYRDLKLDNVLLDYEGHVRIADFGMCKLQIYLDKTADSFCGTPDYMAPEIIKGESYNQNVDWWSFGVLLYEMLIGQSPFSGCDEDELFWSICNEIPWFPVYISAEATSILKGLLEKDYTKRIGSQYSPAGDIVEHIFFRPIDWNLLEKRQIEPPVRPQVKHPLDTQYFDRVFTRERVRLTPIDKDILQSMDQKQFLGFTYTNPHITLDE